MMFKVPFALPVSLLDNVAVLTKKKSHNRIYLLGTSHVSKRSCENVRELVQLVKPKTVMLELCDRREAILKDRPEGEEVKEISFYDEILSMVKGNSNLFAIFFSRLQREIGKNLDAPLGGEFKAGNEAAKLCNAEVILGDRPADITIQRVWFGLSRYEKLKLGLLSIGSLISLKVTDNSESFNMLENPNLRDSFIVDSLLEFGNEFPWIVESLINERDLYMMHRLHNLLESLDVNNGVDEIDELKETKKKDLISWQLLAWGIYMV
jgi:pheromone shutdown protein TraB